MGGVNLHTHTHRDFKWQLSPSSLWSTFFYLSHEICSHKLKRNKPYSNAYTDSVRALYLKLPDKVTKRVKVKAET